MLVHARMKRAVLAVALVAASSGVASAGGYIGLGIGTGPAVNSDDYDFKVDGRSARLMGGFRFGRISVEAALGGFDQRMQVDPNGGFFYPIRIYQASISGKYNLPLSDGFEAFGRLGLQRSQLTLEGDSRFDASGTGVLAAVGMEYVLPTVATKASIWIDYQYSRSSLDGEIVKTDLSARQWTLGATIGF